MGHLAAEMLIRHIESKQAVTPQKVYLDATLIVRGSTAPPAVKAAGSSDRSRIHRLQSASSLTAARPAASGGHPQPR
jgi:hypothetical protein